MNIDVPKGETVSFGCCNEASDVKTEMTVQSGNTFSFTEMGKTSRVLRARSFNRVAKFGQKLLFKTSNLKKFQFLKASLLKQLK